jgi:hypothetical protein
VHRGEVQFETNNANDAVAFQPEVKVGAAILNNRFPIEGNIDRVFGDWGMGNVAGVCSEGVGA